MTTAVESTLYNAFLDKVTDKRNEKKKIDSLYIFFLCYNLSRILDIRKSCMPVLLAIHVICYENTYGTLS